MSDEWALGVSLLATDNWFPVHRNMIRAVGTNAALLLGELANKAKHYGDNGKVEDGWFYATVEDVKRNTGLGERIQAKSLDRMASIGLVEVEYKGMPRRRWVRINSLVAMDILGGNTEPYRLAWDDESGDSQCPQNAVTANCSDCKTSAPVPAKRRHQCPQNDGTANIDIRTEDKNRGKEQTSVGFSPGPVEEPEGKPDEVDRIVATLNERVGSRFSPKAKQTRSNINARLREGYTFEDFVTVIDKKCREWMGTEYAKFLNPNTLFCQSHFDTYLNQLEVTAKKREERNDEYRSYGGFGDELARYGRISRGEA